MSQFLLPIIVCHVIDLPNEFASHDGPSRTCISFYSVQMIDMVSAVKELSGLTTKELSEMLRESDNFVLQHNKGDGGPKQVGTYVQCFHMLWPPLS
jgi:hypothetical protein